MDTGETSSPFSVSARTGTALTLTACLFVFAAGQSFIPLLGIENDEAVFANPLFHSDAAYYSLAGIPLMVTNYAGALKTLVYAPIFRVFGTGVWALREPMLLAASLSIWLFFLTLRSVAGVRAGVIGALLLAVDSEYLLTSCYDWGPVALQHLLLIGGVLLAMRFHQTLRLRALAGATFLMGLAMWDKALAVWLISGLTVAVLAVYGRRVFELFTIRRAAIAGAAFCLGALPLILFNVHSRLDTFRKNTARDSIPLTAKASFLLDASRGGSLLTTFIQADGQTPVPHMPSGVLQQISASISNIAGHPRRSGMPYVFLAALLVAPFAGRSGIRAILFCLITFFVAWLEMAFNANTGASVHHTILLWPLPQAIAGISFAGASRKLAKWGAPMLAGALIVPIAAGVLVTNEYHVQMIRNGGTAGWTPALFPLFDSLRSQPAKPLFCMDWGMLNGLMLLSDGHLKLYVGSDPVFNKREISAEDLRVIRWMLEQPDAEFIAHTDGNEFFRGANQQLIQAAGGMGYRQDSVTEISDGFGRNIFEVYRFLRAPQ